MSTKTKELSLPEQRSRLERRANVIRSRLLRTIDALDNRRHQVEELGHHAKRLAAPVGASIVGIGVLALGTSMAIGALVRRSRRKQFGYRLAEALAPLRQPVRPPFWQEAIRRAALAAISLAATELVKRGAHRLLEARDAPIALLPRHVDGK